MQIVFIAHEPLEKTDGNRFIYGLAVAGPLTGGRTNATQHRRQGDIPLHHLQGFLPFSGGNQPVHQWDVHMGRTADLAGGFTIAYMLA